MYKLLKDNRGIGTIEIVILLAILVGIALIFESQITGLVTSILNDITTKFKVV